MAGVSGQVCSYFLCGKSVRNTPGLRKFGFPVKDKERCKKWITNSGKLFSRLITFFHNYRFFTKKSRN